MVRKIILHHACSLTDQMILFGLLPRDVIFPVELSVSRHMFRASAPGVDVEVDLGGAA